MAPAPAPARDLVLKHTSGRCPVCHQASPAVVHKASNTPSAPVLMTRTCPDHGAQTNRISSDARYYWVSHGHPDNARCGCSPDSSNVPVARRAGTGEAAGVLGRNACRTPSNAPFETLSTCVALIEIVRSCNLPCPTCYAASPLGTGNKVDAVPLPEIRERIEGVLARKGGIEILQLSGGEPTLHPEFFELLRWAKAREGIDYLLLNTNGVRLARDSNFVAELGRTFPRGRMQVYLQFDGVQEEGHTALRGADMRDLKTAAIEACARIELPVTLAMTVTVETLSHLWTTVQFGLRHPHVRGVTFQPMVGSGRTHGKLPHHDQGARLNVADIVLGLVRQSEGSLKPGDFTPLPCGDPNCATIGYLLKADGGVRSLSDLVDFSQLQAFLHDRIRYRLEDLARCGCDSEPLAKLLARLEMDASHTFRLMIKPFMDAWTWDQDRIDRCCTHVIRPDGKLDSFCRYYSGFPDAR